MCCHLLSLASPWCCSWCVVLSSLSLSLSQARFSPSFLCSLARASNGSATYLFAALCCVSVLVPSLSLSLSSSLFSSSSVFSLPPFLRVLWRYALSLLLSLSLSSKTTRFVRALLVFPFFLLLLLLRSFSSLFPLCQAPPHFIFPSLSQSSIRV